MLNELRERGSLCSLLQRPGLTGREGGKNTEHRQTITIFHLFCQRENGREAHVRIWCGANMRAFLCETTHESVHKTSKVISNTVYQPFTFLLL